MPTFEWLKREFHYGYDSGDILSSKPDHLRAREEALIGGSYREVFFKAVLPYLKHGAKVLEIGPGKGAWTKAILKYLTIGELHTVDFQDTNKWLNAEKYTCKLVMHQVDDNSFNCLENDYFDFFWSFGALCHNNQSSIAEILSNVLPKMKNGANAVHQYGDWDKLEKYGWERGGIPLRFKGLTDDEIWWPRNNQRDMARIAMKAGWKIVNIDLNIVQRDSIVLLKKE